MPSADSNPRVVVATHAADGTSIFGADREVPLFRPLGPAGSSFAVFDRRGAVPVSNQEAVGEFAEELPRSPPGGVIFCITNIAGNFTVPMHRTLSVDYAVVLSGEIVLKLDNGDEKTVRAGEYIIQAGTSHQWINRTNETCQTMFVGVSAEKVKLDDGTELEATVLKK
jgi:mannose-6-phosphate isomerase-like protein (cupin superfamily)